MSAYASRAVPAVVLALVWLAPATPAQILGNPTIVTAPRRAALAAGDMNRDGRLDLVLADGISTVTVGLGDGFGSCSLGTPVTVGSQPVAIAVADVNGDGRLDAITANAGSNNVSVLLGTGAGGFAAPTNFATGAAPNSIAVGDLNADGRPDLVTTSGAGQMSVLLNSGSGAFAAPQQYPVGGMPLAAAIGDLNADGRPDVATTSFSSGAVSVFTNNGAGALTLAGTVTISGSPQAIAVTDINRDGKADLVVSNRTFNGELIVLIGNGTAGFAPRPPVLAGRFPSAIAVGDFNADGKDDVAITGLQAAVLLGDGLGGLGSPNGVSVFPSSGVSALVAGDFDHDGRLDLVTNEDGSFDRIWLYPGVGAAFGTTVRLVETEPRAVAIADLTGDGAPDVVTANRGSSSVSVLTNNGSGGFGAAQNHPVGAAPADVALGDLNGDNRADVVTANSVANSVSVLLNNGSGGLLAPVAFAAGTGPTAVAILDANRDGRRDVAVISVGAGTAALLLGNGAGGLGAPTIISLPGGLPNALATGDFDGDGDEDLWVALFSGSSLVLLANNGAGGFAVHSVKSLPNVPLHNALGVGDVNGDGRLDAVVTGVNNTVAVLLGDGAGGFLTASILVLPLPATSPVLADVNGDGLVDIALALRDRGSIAVLLGNGTGGFAPGAPLPTVYQADVADLAAADLDADGLLDFVTGNINALSNGIAVMLGRGLVPYGTGTPGCGGMIGSSGAVAPRIGETRFGFTATNAPRNASGTLMVATAPDLLGTSALGLTFQVFLPTIITNLPMTSDASGVGFKRLPIPGSASLINARFYTQSLWAESAGNGRVCSTAFLSLVASRGLATTLRP
jgi:hypothetical protein